MNATEYIRAKLPDGVEHGILIYTVPCTNNVAIVWAGLSAEEVVEMLYEMADHVCGEKIPLPARPAGKAN